MEVVEVVLTDNGIHAQSLEHPSWECNMLHRMTFKVASQIEISEHSFDQT